jgi:cysteine desulfurase/selenocysteine lyase
VTDTPAIPYIDLKRADFSILKESVNGKPLVYLDNGATSQKPDVVVDSMVDFYRRHNANVHRGVHRLSQEATDLFEQARKSVAHYFGIHDQEQIIFTRGTTESINLVATCLSEAFIREGDEILITAMEHHSNIVPWQLACERHKAVLKVVRMDETGTLDMNDFAEKITSRTRIISVVQVSNALGTINPVTAIIALAKSHGIPVMVDGAQSVQHQRIDLEAMGCDFFACSGHKMFGPTGIGVLYGRRELLQSMPPYQGGGDMIKTVTFSKTEYNDIPFRFEAGTPAIAEAVGLAAAVNYLSNLNFHEIALHEQRLMKRAVEIVQSIEGARMIGSAVERAGLVSFIIDGMHPYDIGTLLDQQGIAVRTGHHCAQPVMDFFQIPGTVRASFAFYNTMSDLDRFEHALVKSVNMLRP